MTDATFDKLKSNFPDAVQSSQAFRDETTITVTADRLPEIAQFLRDDPALQYNLRMDVYGVDRKDLKGTKSPRFAVQYELFSIPNNKNIRLNVPVPDAPQGNGALPKISSLTGVWPTANWLERETYDLMGIEFTGHPWLHRIMMPQYWEGHPLRKDTPLGGEPVNFSQHKDDARFATLGKQILTPPQVHSEVEGDVEDGDIVVIENGSLKIKGKDTPIAVNRIICKK